MEAISWHEPITYKWAVAKSLPLWASLLIFAGVAALILGVSSAHGTQPALGWPATYVVAIASGLAVAYVIPFITRFGNRACSIDDSGIRCDELVGSKWRNQQWNWDSIQYCVVKPVVVRRRSYQVLLICTTSGEEHALGISDEVNSNKIESAVLRSGCQLRNA